MHTNSCTHTESLSVTFYLTFVLRRHSFLTIFAFRAHTHTHTHAYHSTLEKRVRLCCQVCSQQWLWPQTAECSVCTMGDTMKKMLQTFIFSSVLPAATVITFANFSAWGWHSVEEVKLTSQLLPINLQLKMELAEFKKANSFWHGVWKTCTYFNHAGWWMTHKIDCFPFSHLNICHTHLEGWSVLSKIWIVFGRFSIKEDVASETVSTFEFAVSDQNNLVIWRGLSNETIYWLMKIIYINWGKMVLWQNMSILCTFPKTLGLPISLDWKRKMKVQVYGEMLYQTVMLQDRRSLSMQQVSFTTDFPTE